MRSVWVAMLAAAAALAVAGSATADPDPYQIFAQARAYWLQQRYPAAVAYDIAVDVTEGGGERVERYSAGLDGVTGEIRVDPVSDYERAHPVKPTGVNLSLLFPIGKPLPPVDFLGVPRLSPTYSFEMAAFVPAPTPTPFDSAALVAEIRREYHDPNPRASATPTARASGLLEIAATTAFRRDYAIAFDGIESVDGHECYHLSLRPTHDPTRLRIRDAWIDTHTFATWKLVDALNFTSGPGTNVPWTIRFADVGGAHYVSEEDANAPMSTHGEIYVRSQIRFEHLRAVARLPQHAPFGFSGTYLEEP